MAEIGLICEASVPEGSTVEIEVKEDTDGDGKFENSNSQMLQDGTYKYLLEGFTGNRESRYATEIHLERKSVEQNPAVSSIELIVPGSSDTTVTNPKTIIDKHQEAFFFYQQFHTGDESAFRYYLSGFLSAAFSIDELLRNESEFGFSEWANTDAEIDLHKFMMDNRHSTVHLVKPDRGNFRPPVGHSQRLDFGPSEEKSEVRVTHFFTGIPESVVTELVPDSDQVELADNTLNQPHSPIVRSAPVESLCGIYLGLLRDRLEDWLNSLDDALLP